MYQTPLQLAASKAFNPAVFAELALRSAEQFYCMNVSATSMLLQTQASAATALGLPDWSPVIAATTEQTRQAVSAGTDQIIQATQQATEAVQAFQRSASELVDEQAAQATDAVQSSMEELGMQARSNLQKLGEASNEALDGASAFASDVVETLHTPAMPLSPLSDAVRGALPHGE